MSMPITQEDVAARLRPWFGSCFLQTTPLCENLSEHLAGYAPYRQTLEELRGETESLLLVKLNRYTGGSMTVTGDNFRPMRINQERLSAITDDLMGIVFEKLTPFSANFIKLNDYSMRVQSLNALRVLYQKYRSFYEKEELDFLIRMIKSIYPRECYITWLEEEEEPQ